jgi:hypothetical protein
VVASRAGASVEVYDSFLRAQRRWVTCLKSMMACSGSGMRWWRAPRSGSRRRRALRLGSRTMMCSKTRDDATVCSGARIQDNRRWRHDGV